MTTASQPHALPYVRLLFEASHPNLEECWLDGYRMAHAEISEDDNPYPKDSLEYHQWSDGWWAGFYGEEPLYEVHHETAIEAVGTVSELQVNLPAANDAPVQQKSGNVWAWRITKLASVLAVTYAAFELAELAA